MGLLDGIYHSFATLNNPRDYAMTLPNIKSIQDGINVVWFDDEPDEIVRVRHKLQEARVSLVCFKEIDATFEHLNEAVVSGAENIPDVVITDLLIINEPGRALELAEWTDSRYRQELGVCGRIGVASNFPQQIAAARREWKVTPVFAFATHALLGHGLLFGALLRCIRKHAARSRLDRWCAEYDQMHPLPPVPGAGHNKEVTTLFGTVYHIDSETVSVKTWNVTDWQSERKIVFERSAIARTGQYELDCPVRIREIKDLTDPNEVQCKMAIHRIEGVGKKSYVPLRPDIDFSKVGCFRGRP